MILSWGEYTPYIVTAYSIGMLGFTLYRVYIYHKRRSLLRQLQDERFIQ